MLAAICLCATVLLLKHLALMTFFLTVGCTATVMFGNALMGWLPDMIEDKHYGQVGAWSNVANLGAAGVFGTLAVVLVRTLPIAVAAPMLAVVLMAPTVLLFFFPAPVPPTRGVSGDVSDFFPRSLSSMPEPKLPAWLDDVFVAGQLLCADEFVFRTGQGLSCAGAMGDCDRGAGVAIVCSVGCVVAIGLCERFARSRVYVMTGFCGAVFALGLI